MAVKPGKPDRKRTQRVESATRLADPGKPSRTPTLRPQMTRNNASQPPASRTSRPPNSRSSRPRPPRPEPSAPEITLRRASVGRETLAAIEEELAREVAVKIRPKLDTLDYDERPREPSSSRPPQTSAPEVITYGEAPIGRATLAAIDEALAEERAAAERSASTQGRRNTAPFPAVEPAQIFEISTFIVEGEEIFSKASEQARRDFVEQRLLHRLPALSMKEVVRIDFSRGAAANTVILRIWSKVSQSR